MNACSTCRRPNWTCTGRVGSDHRLGWGDRAVDWDRAIPWEDLTLLPDDTPGWLARSVVSASRWLAAHLTAVALMAIIFVTDLVAAGLFVGAVDRDGALRRLQRLLFASLALVLAVSGATAALAIWLARTVEQGVH